MPCTDYRPEIGETIFVSFSGNVPTLITVTGFHYHTYLKEEVMDFDRADGTSSWSTYKGQTFFPEIPIDTPYIFVLMMQNDFEDAWSYTIEAGFFFDAADAFRHRDGLLKGDIPLGEHLSSDPDDYIVEVRQVRPEH